MGDLIAGYDTPDQYQEYCMHGGGKEMLQKIYDSLMPGKIKVLGCGPYGKEAFVSTVPIRGVADLKGLNCVLQKDLLLMFSAALALRHHQFHSLKFIPLLKKELSMQRMRLFISTITLLVLRLRNTRSIQVSTQWLTFKPLSINAFGIKCQLPSKQRWNL